MSVKSIPKPIQIFRENWIFLFLLLSLILYLHAIDKKREVRKELEDKRERLEVKRAALLEEKEELELEVASQEDPAWIERTLIKEMGVVPEGKVKVYFEKQ